MTIIDSLLRRRHAIVLIAIAGIVPLAGTAAATATTEPPADTIDVEIGYLFHPSALEDPLFEHKLALSDVGVQVFVRQDQDATTKVQRGLHSRYAPRGRYSWQEESHVQFNRWLVQRYRRKWPGVAAASPRQIA